MLKSILISLLTCAAISTKAQNSDTRDTKIQTVAKLHDGSVYIGKKLSEVDDIITLELNIGDTVSFHRMLGKDILDEKSAIFIDETRYHRTNGRFLSFQFGFHSNFLSENPAISTHLEYSYLWRLQPNFNIGPALGFEFNESDVAGFVFNTSFLSLGIQGRYYLNSSSRRLYSFARLAYGFPGEENQEGTQREHTGGVNFIAGIGLQFPFKKKSSFHLNVGQYFQRTSGSEFFLDNLGNEINTEFDIFIKQLILKAAWDF